MEFLLKVRANSDKIFALYDELSNIDNEFFYELVLDCWLTDVKVVDENTSVATFKGNVVNDIYSLLETDNFFDKKQKCLFDEEVDFEVWTTGEGFYQYCLYQDGGVIKTSGELKKQTDLIFTFDNPEVDILQWINQNLS